MTTRGENSLKYLTIAPDDRIWGVVTTTVGSQKIAPNACYPAMPHPSTHEFKPQNGRILDEYQLVYITEGAGFFESKSVPRQRIEAGTVILLFPGEWHNYAPEESCGWQEYWVGFQGENINRLVDAEFFARENALIKIGISNTIISLYRDAIRIAEQASNTLPQQERLLTLRCSISSRRLRALPLWRASDRPKQLSPLQTS